MGSRLYKPYTPGTRNRCVDDFKDITEQLPEKSLIQWFRRSHGRNNRGIITSRARGSGHKRLYRCIDFKRKKIYLPGVVKNIQYDPNRNAHIALLQHPDGCKSYILHPKGLKPGTTVLAAPKAPISVGNSLPLKFIPLGTEVHNIELQPGMGGKLARAAGSVAYVMAKQGNYVSVKLPSGEIRYVLHTCWASIGQVGNIDAENFCFGKAGAKRWKGKRPKVRGIAMNPNDHPHGGGEGRSPIGRKYPVSLWGRPALGQKTRNQSKLSSKLIIKRRKGFKG